MKNSIYVRLMCLILLSALVLTQNQLLSKAQVIQTNNLTDPKELEAFGGRKNPDYRNGSGTSEKRHV